MENFSDEVTYAYNVVFGIVIDGMSNVQLVCEAIVIIIFFRTWRHRWLQGRAVITVESDNGVALTVMAKLQGSSPMIAIIGGRSCDGHCASSIYSGCGVGCFWSGQCVCRPSIVMPTEELRQIISSISLVSQRG